MRLTVHNGGSLAGTEISGDSLPNLICRGWRAIAAAASLDNLPGYTLTEVTAAYRNGILGGKGGIEISISYRQHYLDDLSPVKSATVWLCARPEDCPEPVSVEIRAKKEDN